MNRSTIPVPSVDPPPTITSVPRGGPYCVACADTATGARRTTAATSDLIDIGRFRQSGTEKGTVRRYGPDAPSVDGPCGAIPSVDGHCGAILSVDAPVGERYLSAAFWSVSPSASELEMFVRRFAALCI